MKVRFAVSPPAGLAPEHFVEFVAGLEARRFDTLWLSDVPVGPGLDPIVALGVAAAASRRLKLGANVVPIGANIWRLAKQLAQLDQVSQGRLLLTLVPGLGSAEERSVLALDGDRGALLEEATLLLRRLWSGESVAYRSATTRLPGVRLTPRPQQDPLEIWLAGHGPRALERAGRLADGWLGSALTPEEAGAARAAIVESASAAGRSIDPEHFGLSIPYSRGDAQAGEVRAAGARRPEVERARLVPVGAEELRRLVEALVAAGLSKFVLRPLAVAGSLDTELDWLAGVVLGLQS